MWNFDNCPYKIGQSDKDGKYYDGCKMRGMASTGNSNVCVGTADGCDILQEKINFTKEILK